MLTPGACSPVYSAMVAASMVFALFTLRASALYGNSKIVMGFLATLGLTILALEGVASPQFGTIPYSTGRGPCFAGATPTSSHILVIFWVSMRKALRVALQLQTRGESWKLLYQPAMYSQPARMLLFRMHTPLPLATVEDEEVWVLGNTGRMKNSVWRRRMSGEVRLDSQIALADLSTGFKKTEDEYNQPPAHLPPAVRVIVGKETMIVVDDRKD
jgi:hypothetical protein